MKLLKKNIFYIILCIMAVFAVIMRKQELRIPVVSHPDSRVAFSTEDSFLEQTWQPYVKKVAGVSVPYTAGEDFEGDVELLIYSDDYSELLVQTSIHKAFQENEEGTLAYDFKTIKVIPGERYRLQLHFGEASQEGTLFIASGSDYGGCSIQGNACNEAAAFEIVSVKNSSVFWAFMVFFPFLSFSLLFMTAWNRRWEECIGLSMIITGAVLYTAGLFGQLMAGMALVYVFSVVSILFSVYFYNKKGMQVKDLYSPALFLYAALFLLILINCRDARFAKVDEYSQWGMAVKDMFYYQSFAKHIDTTVVAPRYPPFAALVEYFFVYANGLFTPKMVYIAFQTMAMSASMVICGAAGRKWRYLLPSVAIIIAMPAIFFTDAYNCVIVDPLLAVFTAYVLVCYYTEEMKGFNLFRILGGLFALTLTKDMGMVIAGLLAGIMAADRLYQALRQKKNIVRSLICPCACVLFVIGIYMSWQVYMSIPVKAPVSETANVSMLAGIYEETASLEETVMGEPEPVGEESAQSVSFQGTVSASGITLDGILGLLRHEDGGYRYQTIKNFLLEIFDGDTYRLGNISFSYVDIFLIMLVLTGVLGYFRFWGEHLEKMISFGIFTFLAGICYSVVLLFLFLFAFVQGEALGLIGHERYLASFLGGIVSALAALVLHRAAEREENHRSHSLTVAFCLTVCIVLCTPVSSFIIKNRDVKIMDDHVYGYDSIAEILRSFSRRSESIYFVCNGSAWDSYWIFRNTVSPLLSPHSEYNLYASEEIYLEQEKIWLQNGEEEQGKGTIVPCEIWEEELKSYQYVFILRPSEMFRESYRSLFEEPDTIGDGTFYQVKCVDGKVTLAYIGETGVKSFK